MATTSGKPGLPGRRPRKIPQRTCIACRSVRMKRDLVRVVRLADGTVTIDETGKKSGRGAYLCRQRTCWETGIKRGILERALKQPIPEVNRAELEAFTVKLPNIIDDATSERSQ